MISHRATPRPPAGTDEAGGTSATANAPGSGSIPAAAGQPDSGRHRHRGEPRSPYCEVFAVREFEGLWYAQVLSCAGDQFAQIAVAAGVYQRTRSPFLAALVYAMSYLPQIIGGPLLADVAGLFSRRGVMIGLSVTRAALVAIMALSRMPFAALCALLVSTVMLGAAFSGARAAMVPEVLPDGQRDLGAEIGSVTCRAGQVLGFLAGGAFAATLGPRGTLLAGAVTFAAAAVIVARWLASRPVPQRSAAARPLALPVSRSEAAAIVRAPVPRTLLILGWLSSCAVVPEALAGPYAHVLHGGPLTAGLLMAAIPAGTVAGAVAIAFLALPSGRLRLMSWLAVLSCAPLVASSLHPPLWAVLALWVLAGAGCAYQLAAVTALVRAVPAAARAGAVDLAQAGLLAAQGAGLLLAGLAAQLIGPRAAVSMTGFFGLAAATTLARTWQRLQGDAHPARRLGALAATPASTGGGTGQD
jgi:predicted MFS family arabinose efflux permease